MKGVTLNYVNSEAVNFDNVKYFILDNIMGSEMLSTMFTDKYIYTEQMQFKKNTNVIFFYFRNFINMFFNSTI